MSMVRKRLVGRTAAGVKIAAVLLLLFAGISAVAAILFTAPAPADIGAVRDLPFPASDVAFGTADGLMIRGWYAPSGADSGTVILLHGYQGNRTHMIPRARMLREAGYGVLLYDARGCGTSDGDIVSMGYHETEDLLAAVGFLRERGERRIACIGVSQGGATIALAGGRLAGVRGAVCESTYDDLDNSIDRRFRHYIKVPSSVAGWLLHPVGEWRLGCRTAAIAPADSIGRLRAPLYIISGDSDTRVWNEDTRRLFAAAPEPKKLWFVPGADHVDLYGYAPQEYRRRLLGFLEECMKEG